MTLDAGLALGLCALLALTRRVDVADTLCRLLWTPPPRHEHMAAMDRLAQRGDPGHCWSCGAPLDALGSCLGVCDPSDEGDLPW